MNKKKTPGEEKHAPWASHIPPVFPFLNFQFAPLGAAMDSPNQDAKNLEVF
jgi:hypothetical protein